MLDYTYSEYCMQVLPRTISKSQDLIILKTLTTQHCERFEEISKVISTFYVYKVRDNHNLFGSY